MTLGQQVVEGAHKVQALTSDRRCQEDGRQAVGVHVARTRDHVILRPYLHKRAQM